MQNRGTIKKILMIALPIFALTFIFSPISKSEKISDWDLEKSFYKLYVEESGRVFIEINKDKYTLDTLFSYPGNKINWYSLGVETLSSWKVEKIVRNQGIELKASSPSYRLERSIKAGYKSIKIVDTLFNTSIEPLGIIVKNKLGYSSFFDEVYLSGKPTQESYFDILKNIVKSVLDKTDLYKMAELHSPSNQSVFLGQSNSYLAILLEDTISASKTFLKNSFIEKNVVLQNRNTSIGPKGAVTFETTIYLADVKGKYFDFVNRVRKERNLNSKIEGSFNFFHIIKNRSLLEDPDSLGKYLDSLNIGILALTPWLDYDNYNDLTDSFITRKEYLDLFSDARNKIKSLKPSVKVLGCIQSNIISLPSSLQKKILASENIDKIGFGYLSKRNSEVVRKANLHWDENDLIFSEDGRISIEFSLYGKENHVPELNVAVEPHSGSYQEKFIYEQINFLVDDVGLDGIYLDQFNQADLSSYQRFSFSRDDGVSVNIDPITGRIVNHYSDMALTTLGFQERIIKFVEEKDIFMVANTFPITIKLNSASIMRFGEGFWSLVSSGFLASNSEPLSSYQNAKSHFSSPIALGIPNWLNVVTDLDKSKIIYKNILFNLKQGNLIYLAQSDYFKSNDGELLFPYEIIGKLFPIEIVEIGEGWIEGKSKFITTVSKEIYWKSELEPLIYLYNEEGERITRNIPLEKEEYGFKLNLKLNDWNEVAILADPKDI